MTQAHVRTANLLGASALAIADDLEALAAAVPGASGGSAAAALVLLLTFGGACSPDVVATGLALSPSGTVRLADRLEREGLLERRRRGDDRRALTLALTPRGRRVARRLRRDREATLSAWLSPLDDAEQRLLADFAARLLDARTEGRRHAWRLCRLCDADACGHPDRCPVTRAADAAEAG